MIRSHVIPRHYLQLFEDSGERIWVYTKDARPRRGTPFSEGTERGYFAYKTRSGATDESLEAQLAELEDAAIEPLRLLVNQCYVLSLSDKRKLATYIGLMFSRATARRTGSGKMWSEICKAYEDVSKDPDWLLRQTERYKKLTGNTISREDILVVVKKVLKKSETAPERKNAFLTSLLHLAEAIEEELLNRPWQLWDAPDGIEFITTDNPVVTVRADKSGAISVGWGFRNPGVVTMFPIRPTCCLVIGVQGPERRRATTRAVEDVNKTLVMCMDRWAYARSLSKDTEWLVQHAAGVFKYFDNAFVPVWKADEQHLHRLVSEAT